MKYLALLPILFWATLASAQFVDPCTGTAVSGPVTITPIALPMTCVKEQGRTVEFSLKGAVGWRYCMGPNRYSAQIAAATWAEIGSNPAMVKDWLLAGQNADDATISRLAAKWPLGSFTEPARAAVWCPFRAQIAAGAPGPTVWVTTSTVLYRLNEAGTDLGAQVGTAKRGEVVDGTNPSTFGGMKFCPGNLPPFKTFIRCTQQKATP